MTSTPEVITYPLGSGVRITFSSDKQVATIYTATQTIHLSPSTLAELINVAQRQGFITFHQPFINGD